ncbi:MAG: metallophosphoesterase family protein [Ardenticatenaceae bacterium]
MRLAIIADIHGNIHALEAVLRDIDTLHVDQVIVNGDMVNRAPNNILVLERLMGAGYVIMLGNHEDLMCKWIDRNPTLPADWFDDPFWKGTAWSVEQLEEAGWLNKLRDLPMTYRVQEPNAPTLLISHGSPRHHREGYGRFLSDEKFSEIAQLYPADILIGSHTHRPFEHQSGEHLFLNSGAVGAPFNKDSRAQYLLLTLRNQQWEWEFRAVPYDRDAALAAYQESGYVPDGDLSAFIFREELRYSVPIYMPFWMWAHKEKKIKAWPAWHEFWEIYQKKYLTGD